MSNINITVFNSKATQEAAERAEAAASRTLNYTENLIDPTTPGTSGSPAVIPPGPADRKVKFEPEPGFYLGFEEVTSDKRWYFFWDMSSWNLHELGSLPETDISDKTDKGGYSGTAKDLDTRIGTVEQNLEDTVPVEFESVLSGVRFTSDTVTGSIDTTQTVVNENTVRVSRDSTGATGSCVYLNTGIVLNKDKKAISFRYKINAENITNSGIMLGYGSISNIPTVVPRGICWRTGGSLFFLTPYSSSGSFPTQATYAINDIVGIDYEVIFDESETNIIAGRFRLYKNGVLTQWFEDTGVYSGTVMIGFRGGLSYDANGEVQNSNNVLNQAKHYTDVQILKRTSDVSFYVDAAAGSSGIGTFSSPFKTFADAIGSIESIPNAAIIARGGMYRETLNLSDKTLLNVKFSNFNNESVKLFGSNSLTGWTKTADRTNIYQAAFSGTIPAPVRESDPRRLFEYGRSSFPIPAEERHALQRGLSHLLPLTVLYEFVYSGTLGDALTLFDGSDNVNKFYINSGLLYIHLPAGANPNTTGYTIENQVRNILIPPFDKRNVNIELNFIESYFSSNYGFDFLNFSSVTRNNVVTYGSRNNGFGEDIGITRAYRDIAGASGNDASGIHMSRRLGGTAGLDKLSGTNQNLYIDPWYPKNVDDGLAPHQFCDGTCIGGLFEGNGKAGLIPANGANWRQYGGLARNNALAGVFVGNPIEGKPFASARIENFISMNNPSNYRVGDDANWLLDLVNCHSANASGYGYRVSMGKIKSFKCTSYNDANVKFEENGGTIEIVNNGELII